MQEFLHTALYVLMLATLVVLLFGIVNMFRGGANSGAKSNKFMRMRILFQGAALILFFVVLYFIK